MTTPRFTADAWVDPSCPYTWLASRWLTEAAAVRPIDVRWHVLSISALYESEARDDPEGGTAEYLWYPVRLGAAIVERFGSEAFGEFYTAFGERVHVRGERGGGTFPDALGDAGLPPALADAALDPELDGAVRASTAEGAALVGEPEPSSPVIAVTGAGGERFAFSGPVVSRVPRGEDAGRLWEGVVLTASVDGFNVLRGRPRTDPDPDPEIG